jgi:hypothetical protein
VPNTLAANPLMRSKRLDAFGLCMFGAVTDPSAVVTSAARYFFVPQT